MRELTLSEKVSSEISKINQLAPIKLTNEEQDSIVSESLCEFSKHVPYVLVSELEQKTDGIRKIFNLPQSFLGLFISTEYPSGVKRREQNSTDTEDVDGQTFSIRNLSQLYFPKAPETGYALVVQYMKPWTEETLPQWATRAVVFFAIHFSIETWTFLSSVNLSGAVSATYRDLQKSYYEKALESIKNFSVVTDTYSVSRENIEAWRV